jgi:hypothetical protein
MFRLKYFGFTFIIAVLLFAVVGVSAQMTSFTYQGKLNDGAIAANGTYQFEFKLFDAAAGGNQIGQTISNLPATVTSGIFAATLDFGAASFDGSPRFLEISVRLGGSGQPYTLLNPRQAVSSTPYAVRSLNANQATTADNSANLGGIPAAQYTQTNDSRLSDDRNPLPNSPNYIQNTTVQQNNSNFNVSGEGRAGVLNAVTQFNLNSVRILTGSQGLGNLFIGAQSGETNPSVGANTFVGVKSGKSTTTGYQNSFFGQSAGLNNLDGHDNSIFGNFAGGSNTSGSANAFFGSGTGYSNTLGNDNSFFGVEAGINNKTGSGNTFLGRLAGLSNTIENNNTFIGFKANGAAGITNATAIGANAVVTQSNTMVLGTSAVTVQVPGNLTVANTFSANALDSATVYKIGGVRIFHKTGTDNLFAGIDAGNVTTGGFNAFFGALAGKFNTTGFNNAFVGAYAGRDNQTGSNNAFFGANSGLSNNIGGSNSFFGSNAGLSNTSGAGNSFFGNGAGLNNLTGLNNSFFGLSAGETVASGGNNAFFGAFAGWKTTAGGNSFFGTNAGEKTTSGFSNSFFGLRAGQNNLTGSGNVFLGFEAGINLSSGTDNIFIGAQAGDNLTGGSGNIVIGKGAFCVSCNNNIAIGTNAFVSSGATNSIAIGDGASILNSNEVFIGNGETLNTRLKGTIRIDTIVYFPNTAKFAVCQEEFTNRLVRCSSSGFAAETSNPEVKSLETAFNEQKAEAEKQRQQIEAQAAENQKLQEQVKRLKTELEAIKAIVCASNPTAAICQPK